MTKYFIAVALTVLVVYGLIKAWPLLAGPSISVISPVDNASYENGIVVVSGRAIRAAEFSIDGMPVLREKDGSFSSTLSFPRGNSTLTFVATDRFGKTRTATRAIFVQ